MTTAKYLNTSAAARELGISRQAVDDRIRRKTLTVERVERADGKSVAIIARAVIDAEKRKRGKE